MVILGVSVAGPACTGDDDAGNEPNSPMTCTGSGGPIEDGSVDTHCSDDSGKPIEQQVGKCASESDVGAAGAGGAGEEEESEIHTSHLAQDDDCKYDVSFSVGCVELGTPATFTVKVDKRAAGGPASGDVPDNPEVYLESDSSHISPSNHIKAPEGPAGTYKIGPIVFDRPGRWVVRFHFFELCTDVPEDSPHGHVGFYIDVP